MSLDSTFDLVIDKAGPHYRVQVPIEKYGRPIEEVLIDRVQRELHQRFPGLVQRIEGWEGCEPVPPRLETAQVGEWLSETFLTGGVKIAWNTWSKPIGFRRLRLVLDEAPEVSALPWEALCAASGFVALHDQITVVRSRTRAQPGRYPVLRSPVLVLFLSGPNCKERPLDAESELEGLRQAVKRPNKKRLEVRVERSSSPPAEVVEDPLLRDAQILHVSSHGFFSREVGVAGTRLAGAGDGDDFQLPQDWATEVARLSRLQLVVLNSCEGARHGYGTTQDSLASAFVRAGVPAVIAMQFQVSNPAAVAFTGTFYETLAEGGDIEGAVTRARQAVRRASPREWLSPVLYLSGGSEPETPPSIWERIKAWLRAHPRWSAAVLLGLLALSAAAPFREEIAERSWRVLRKVKAPEEHRDMTLPHDPKVGCPDLPGTGIELVPIPAKEFRMGSDTGPPDERPAHLVRFSQPFCIGKTEVTQDQWTDFMGANPSKQKGGDLPVTNVSWEEALDFTRRVNDRFPKVSCTLPSEAQFEFVAGAGERLAYGVGETEDLAYFANCDADGLRDGYRRLAPVKAFLRNRWGVFGMAGNAGEWVLDRYGPYRGGPQVDPQGPLQGERWEAEKRVRRGGSYKNGPGNCRSTSRDSSEPTMAQPHIGFRIVCAPRTIPPGTPDLP